jgi:hypothetical protein
MLPTFKNGRVLAFRGPYKEIEKYVGRVVLIVRPQFPNTFFIKRVKRIENGAFWVEGDNLDASTDSRTWGLIPVDQVIAVAFRK